MKRRIDLFSQRLEKKTTQKYLDIGTRILFGIFIFIFLSQIVLFGAYYLLNKNLEELKIKKHSYNRFILSNKAFNRDIQYFVSKFALLRKYLLTDANGNEYYKHIIDIFSPISSISTLSSFTINNTRETTITLNMETNEDALQVVDFLETSEILDNFENLTISDLSIEKSATEYSIQLNGIVKLLKIQ